MDAECFKRFSDDLLLPLKELLQTRYIFLEAEVEYILSWITVFCVKSLTFSNKSTMKPLCWNIIRNVRVFFLYIFINWNFGTVTFCQM